jgi:hypothetical protein
MFSLQLTEKGRINIHRTQEQPPNPMNNFDQEPTLDPLPSAAHSELGYLDVAGDECTDLSCLHGLLQPSSPEQRLSKNLRSLDSYYQKQLTFDIDFDERYFINSDGRLRTPIKLISPISFSNNNAQSFHQPS